MNKSEKKQALGQGDELRAIVLVALSPNAYHDPQRTANKLAKCKEVESVDILTGNWDLAVEVKTETLEAFYSFLKKTISDEDEIAKTNSLISLKRINHTLH